MRIQETARQQAAYFHRVAVAGTVLLLLSSIGAVLSGSLTRHRAPLIGCVTLGAAGLALGIFGRCLAGHSHWTAAAAAVDDTPPEMPATAPTRTLALQAFEAAELEQRSRPILRNAKRGLAELIGLPRLYDSPDIADQLAQQKNRFETAVQEVGDRSLREAAVLNAAVQALQTVQNGESAGLRSRALLDTLKIELAGIIGLKESCSREALDHYITEAYQHNGATSKPKEFEVAKVLDRILRSENPRDSGIWLRLSRVQ